MSPFPMAYLEPKLLAEHLPGPAQAQPPYKDRTEHALKVAVPVLTRSLGHSTIRQDALVGGTPLGYLNTQTVAVIVMFLKGWARTVKASHPTQRPQS